MANGGTSRCSEHLLASDVVQLRKRRNSFAELRRFLFWGATECCPAEDRPAVTVWLRRSFS